MLSSAPMLTSKQRESQHIMIGCSIKGRSAVITSTPHNIEVPKGSILLREQTLRTAQSISERLFNW